MMCCNYSTGKSLNFIGLRFDPASFFSLTLFFRALFVLIRAFFGSGTRMILMAMGTSNGRKDLHISHWVPGETDCEAEHQTGSHQYD